MTVYVASKVKHAPTWLRLRAGGLDVKSTWIDEAGDEESPSLPDLWRQCVIEAATADVLLLYVEPGEVLKGALVEVGAALAAGKKVLVVGEPDGSWVNHPRVRRVGSLDEAVALIKNSL